MTAAPRLLEEIKDVSLRFHPQSKYQDLEYAKNRARTATELAKLAEEQIRDGIPHLYRYATVWSWTIFEVSIDDFCIAFLLENERWRKSKRLAEIEGPLLEFAAASNEDRVQFLLGAVKQQMRAPVKVGVSGTRSASEWLQLGE